MEFWLIAGGLVLAISVWLGRALFRAAPEAQEGSDLAVYRDQLSAVDRDLARGIVSDDEAERLRLEIKRRLLDADRQDQAAAPSGTAPTSLTYGVLAACAVALLLGSFGAYRWLGAPGYPDLPLQARLDASERAKALRPNQATAENEVGPAPEVPADPDFLVLMERLRATVESRPGDIRGQQLLARNEAVLGRFAQAWPAQLQVVLLKGDTAQAEDYAQLGDLMVLAAGGYVSPEAENAFSAALERDIRQPMARYYMGLMNSQIGRPDLAFRIWARLLNESPPDAPWVPPIRGQIEEMALLAGVDYVLPPEGTAPRGPSAADVEAAGEMTQAERMEMVRGMVSGLAERLGEEGGPPEDWARLIRALGVLGNYEAARSIYAEAQQVFSEDQRALVSLIAAARDAGIIQ